MGNQTSPCAARSLEDLTLWCESRCWCSVENRTLSCAVRSLEDRTLWCEQGRWRRVKNQTLPDAIRHRQHVRTENNGSDLMARTTTGTVKMKKTPRQKMSSATTQNKIVSFQKSLQVWKRRERRTNVRGLQRQPFHKFNVQTSPQAR